jgi:outer membrane receptor protein involved in Fe transport
VFFNYAYQRPVERPTGARTSDVPSNLANVGLTVGVGRYLSVTSTVRARGERPRIGIDPRDPVKGYGLLNLNVRLKNVFDALEIAATVGNVFNATYYDPSPFLSVPGDYPTPGRNAILKVGYRF